MIAMVDPVPYNSNTFKDTCDSFDYELQKNSQFVIIGISQSKPNLWYNFLCQDMLSSVLNVTDKINFVHNLCIYAKSNL